MQTWRTPALVGLLLVAGCSSPSAPPPPVGGGALLVLDREQFASTVEPVLAAHGCDAGGDCHGGGIRGTFELSPETAKDVDYDFTQACMQVDPYDREQSPLLTKPLTVEAGGVLHSVQPFTSTDDPDYQTIRAWIMAGVLQ